MTEFLTYDQNNLIGAGANVYYAPFSTTRPAYMSDIFDGTDPYGTKTGWAKFGATSGPPVIARNLTVAGFQIQQTNVTLLEEPTDLKRTLQVPIAEFSPTILALLEESTAATYASGTKRGTGTNVPFGNINSLSSFRLAVFARKSKQQGLVTETATSKTRGAFFGWVAYKASLSGDNLQTSIARGALADITVTFNLYPDPAVTTEGAEMGMWMSEDAGQSIT
jgi:hypothetical protein